MRRRALVSYERNHARFGNDFFWYGRLGLGFPVFSTLLETVQLVGFRYPLWFWLRWVRVNMMDAQRDCVMAVAAELREVVAWAT